MTIQAKYKLKGSLNISGDKSISHRSVIMGAMSIGETKIYNLLESKDILSTVSILRKLGVKVKKKKDKSHKFSKNLSVLLRASVKIFFVSRMRDFFCMFMPDETYICHMELLFFVQY